jgi:hypothetical protein
MSDAPGSPHREAGWYPDPERAHTLRYWDGDAWSDDRAPDVPSVSSETRTQTADSRAEEGGLTADGRFAVGVGLAVVGAIIAIVGVFLPLADTESSLHIAKNSLIQHWEGPVVIAVALGGLLAALHPKTRPLAGRSGECLPRRRNLDRRRGRCHSRRIGSVRRLVGIDRRFRFRG